MEGEADAERPGRRGETFDGASLPPRLARSTSRPITNALSAHMATLLWLLRVLRELLRSVVHSVLQLRRTRKSPPCSDAALNCPVVLLPGNMGDAAATARQLQACGICAIDAELGPVSSCHDRACELFYALVGGRIDYGARHSAEHGHARYGRLCKARHPEWSAARPVLLLCHSQGASTALTLLQLLTDGHFHACSRHATSALWVRGVCTVASPLSGVSWVHSLPYAGVPPPLTPSLTPQRCVPAACEGGEDDDWDGQPHHAQSVGVGVVGWVIVVGYVLHVLLSRVVWITEHVWDWRLEHWRLGFADVLPLVAWRHRLLHTTDTALYGLTPAGAHALAGRVQASVYYVSITCRVTVVPNSQDSQGAATARSCPLPRGAVARPWHVAFAATGAATARRACCRHSDGLVPTCAQAHPPMQPCARLACLSPPPVSSPEAHAAQRAVLVEALQPGVWCTPTEPWALDHSASQLAVDSDALAFALAVVLPAMCEAAAPLRPANFQF